MEGDTEGRVEERRGNSSQAAGIEPSLRVREPEEESQPQRIAWCAVHSCRPDMCGGKHDPAIAHLAWALDNLQLVLGVAAQRGIKIIARYDGRSRCYAPPADVLAQGTPGPVQPPATTIDNPVDLEVHQR